MENESLINIFVTNLGEYNNGKLIGEWVGLPISREEYQAVLDRIGIGKANKYGEVFEEVFITDFDAPDLHNFKVNEYDNIDYLNFLAKKLSELSPDDLALYKGILETGMDSFSNITEYINLADHLDCYDLTPDVKDFYDLGKTWAEIGGYTARLSDIIKDCIDYKKLGERFDSEETGGFAKIGYIAMTHSYDNEEVNLSDNDKISIKGESGIDL